MKKRSKLSFLALMIICICMTGCLAACGNPSVQRDSQMEDAASSEKNTSEQDSSVAKQPSVSEFNFEAKVVQLNSGYEMPIAGLGTYALSDEECYNSVTANSD